MLMYSIFRLGCRIKCGLPSKLGVLWRADFDNASLEILGTDTADKQVPVWPSQVLAFDAAAGCVIRFLSRVEGHLAQLDQFLQ